MKTEQPADRREMYRSAMAPYLSEPILAIGIFSPGGALTELKDDYSVGRAIGMVSPKPWLRIRAAGTPRETR